MQLKQSEKRTTILISLKNPSPTNDAVVRFLGIQKKKQITTYQKRQLENEENNMLNI
jgi:hypothetical protein